MRIEAAQFDPLLSLNIRERKFLDQHDIQAGIGWETPLRWGGTTNLALSYLRTNDTLQQTDDGEDIALKWTQPLLKGLGRQIKQGPLVIAKKQLEISELTFASRVMDILLKTVSSYWELIFQTENLLVQQNSLNLAQQLLTVNQTKVRLGLLAPIEILIAESSVASREEAVIIAEKGLRDLEDQIGNLIGLWGDSVPFLERIHPTDRPLSDEMLYDPNDLLARAFKNRPEILAANHQIENGITLIEIAENKRRPSLDFVGEISNNLDEWDAGLFLTVPIGNQAAIAVVQKEKAAQQKLQIEKQKLTAQIELEVREGGRRVTSDFERIKATSRALTLTKKQLSAGEERFHLGFLSSHDLLGFQNDVTIAEGHALRAIIDYNKSLANLYRVTGTLLEKHNVQLSPYLKKG